MGRKPELKTKTFVSPEGREVTMTVELFPWEKLDAVDAVKAALSLS
jgi:S-adenosylmethionine synthetase